LLHLPKGSTPFGLVVQSWLLLALSKTCGVQSKSMTSLVLELSIEVRTLHSITNNGRVFD